MKKVMKLISLSKIRYVFINAGLKSDIIETQSKSKKIERKQVKSKPWFNKSCGLKSNNSLLEGKTEKRYGLFRKKLY